MFMLQLSKLDLNSHWEFVYFTRSKSHSSEVTDYKYINVNMVLYFIMFSIVSITNDIESYGTPCKIKNTSTFRKTEL